MSLSSFKELQREYWMAGSQTKGGGGKWNETHEDRTSTTYSNNDNNAGDKILTPSQHAYIQETSIHFVPCVHRNRRLSRIFLKSLSPATFSTLSCCQARSDIKSLPAVLGLPCGLLHVGHPWITSQEGCPGGHPNQVPKPSQPPLLNAKELLFRAPSESELWAHLWTQSPHRGSSFQQLLSRISVFQF